MTAHTVFFLCWLVGMAAAVALAYNDNVLLAFFVLLICSCLKTSET